MTDLIINLHQDSYKVVETFPSNFSNWPMSHSQLQARRRLRALAKLFANASANLALGHASCLAMLFNFLIIFCLPLTSSAHRHPDLVTSLSFLSHPNLRHYSGYLSSHQSTHLFYWFFESTSPNSSSTTPLLLFLNGGPGCSSLFGALEELGPFLMRPNGSLVPNPHTWTSSAHVLFLETPPGTGFSYQDNVTEYSTNDTQSAVINHQALRSFFRKFPHLLENPFYIAGESYAAVYIAHLSLAVLDSGFPPNFRAIAIGNGDLDRLLEYSLQRSFLAFHGIQNFTFRPAPNRTRRLWKYNFKRKCSTSLPGQYLYMKENIFGSDSYEGPFQTQSHPWNTETSQNRFWNSGTQSTGSAPESCESVGAITRWLNRPDIQRLLHVDGSFRRSKRRWILCSGFQKPPRRLKYSESRVSIAPYLRAILDSGRRVVLYNGDADLMCNFWAARKFVETLAFKQLSKRQFKLNQTVIGTVTEYERGLTFVRFYDAGHMVPVDSPEGALKMFQEIVLDDG